MLWSLAMLLLVFWGLGLVSSSTIEQYVYLIPLVLTATLLIRVAHRTKLF
jgi:hypothetical protein